MVSSFCNIGVAGLTLPTIPTQGYLWICRPLVCCPEKEPLLSDDETT
jgi:hypothetical protein